MSIAEKRQNDIAIGPTQNDGASKKSKVKEQAAFNTNSAFKELLITHPVENLAYKKQGGLVYFVDRTDRVIDVFKGLIEHGFLSVPVLQKTKHKWYGFVELSDIVQFYVEQFGDQLAVEGKSALDAIGKSGDFLAKNVDDIMKYPLTRQNIFHPITNGYSLWYAIEAMAREEHLHRVPIIDENRQLKSVLSQSQVIDFVHRNIEALGSIKDKPIEQMRGVLKEVFTVKDTSLAIDAFKMMQQHSLTGVAVINESGAVIGNLSVRDLKGLRLENQLFHRLYQTVHNFLIHMKEERKEDGRPRTKKVVHATDKLSHVIEILVQENIHRVYIVGEGNKPIGVVSLKDVLFEIISN